jgi:hypothetical protein
MDMMFLSATKKTNLMSVLIAPGHFSLKTVRAEPWLKLSFFLLQFADLTLTKTAVSFGLIERNPLIQHLLSLPFQLVMVKLLAPAFIAWIVPGKWLIPAVILLVLVTVVNFTQLPPFATG